MTLVEQFEKYRNEMRPCEPYSESENPEQWARVLAWQEDYSEWLESMLQNTSPNNDYRVTQAIKEFNMNTKLNIDKLNYMREYITSENVDTFIQTSVDILKDLIQLDMYPNSELYKCSTGAGSHYYKKLRKLNHTNKSGEYKEEFDKFWDYTVFEIITYISLKNLLLLEAGAKNKKGKQHEAT